MVSQLTLRLFMRGGVPCALIKCGTAEKRTYFTTNGGAVIAVGTEDVASIDEHVVTITQDQLFQLYRDPLKNG